MPQLLGLVASVLVALWVIGLIVAAITAVLQFIGAVLLVLLAVAAYVAPFAYYAVAYGEPDEPEVWFRLKQIFAAHTICFFAFPFLLAASHAYGAFGLQPIKLSETQIVGASEVKAIFYSAFLFVFTFGFSSYFLRDIYPWRSTAPVFNGFLAFISAILLASFTALVAFDAQSTHRALQRAATNFAELAGVALSILFAAMGAYLFAKKVRAKQSRADEA